MAQERPAFSQYAKSLLKQNGAAVRSQMRNLIDPTVSNNHLGSFLLDNVQWPEAKPYYPSDVDTAIEGGIASLNSLLRRNPHEFDEHAKKDPFSIKMPGKPRIKMGAKTILREALQDDLVVDSSVHPVGVHKVYEMAGMYTGHSNRERKVLGKKTYERAILNLIPFVGYCIRDGKMGKAHSTDKQVELFAATVALVQAHFSDLVEKQDNEEAFPIEAKKESMKNHILTYAKFAYGYFGLEDIISRLAHQKYNLMKQ